MHRTDTLLDAGAAGAGAAGAGAEDAFAVWEKDVRDGLATGASDDPTLGPLLHTASAHPAVRAHVERFLDGASLDRDFAGFADEAAYQHYVDAYSLPAFMLVASLLLTPQAEDTGGLELCRSYIDGSQRLDFVNDLAEDLRDDRLALPRDLLDRHGVSRADLERGRDTPGTRAVLDALLDRAHHDLLASRRLPEFAPPEHRAFVRAFVALEILTAEAARAHGGGALRTSARPSLGAAVGVLVREYRRRGR